MPEPEVPYPRTVPADPPTPPAPLLDQRAARALFDNRRRAVGAVGYRLAAEGVWLRLGDGMEAFVAWVDVQAFVLAQHGPKGYPDPPDDPTRRAERQLRRRARRDARGDQ